MIKGRLQLQKELLDRNPDFVLVGGGIILIDEFGKNLGTVSYPRCPKLVRKYISAGFPPAHPTVTFRKSSALRVGLYRENFPHAEDLEFWFRLLTCGEATNIDTPVTCYRVHSNQVSLTERKVQSMSVLDVVAEGLKGSIRSPRVRKFLIARTRVQIKVVSRAIKSPESMRFSRRALLATLFPELALPRMAEIVRHKISKYFKT